MEPTLDLPEALVTQVKLRAEQNGLKLKDEVADLLRKGLSASKDVCEKLVRPIIRIHPKSGLPYVEDPPGAPPGAEFTPERLDEILLEQEVARLLEAG